MGAAPDVEQPPTLAVEVEYCKRIPAWLEDTMKQAEACVGDSKLPVVVLHQEGTGYEDSLMVMRLKDFTHLPAEEPLGLHMEGKESSKPVTEIYTDGGCKGNPGKGA